MDATEAHLTTVVFDADPATAPKDRPHATTHKGITVLFAINRASADEMIEDLIRSHSSPKTLTVVSSDIRIKTAAHRRRARVMTADDFWSELESRPSRRNLVRPALALQPVGRQTVPTTREAAAWLSEFADVDDMDEAHELFHPEPDFITDADLAQISREVEAEFRR